MEFINKLLSGTTYYYLKFVVLFLGAIFFVGEWKEFFIGFLDYTLLMQGLNYFSLALLLLKYKDVTKAFGQMIDEFKSQMGREKVFFFNIGLYLSFLGDFAAFWVSRHYAIPYAPYLVVFYIISKLFYLTLMKFVG